MTPNNLRMPARVLLKERPNIDELVAGAWRAFENAAALPARVCPSIPILFFGDLQAYFDSAVRVLTVGLNPSRREFPSESDFQRFPIAEGIAVSEVNPYLDALSTYFRTHPYRNWFRSFEPMLNGLGASYYEGQDSTALHTDICTPVATDPTWSRLGRAARRVLHSGMVCWRPCGHRSWSYPLRNTIYLASSSKPLANGRSSTCLNRRVLACLANDR